MTTSKSFNVSKYFSENSPIDNIVTGIQPVGIQVYNTVDDLPLSGISAGSQAYVNENNRLYMFTGGGWFSIALINQNPAFDSGGEPESSYLLEINDSGYISPLTITLLATDPEGFPIQYSALLSDSASNFVTVSQDSSVFTITPKSVDSIGEFDSSGGEFSITFRASDGVNLAIVLSEFTVDLSTLIVNSRYTTLMLKTNEIDGANNNTFVDGSTNNLTITRNGNTTQGSFSPYGDRWSNYFDGAGDYVSVPNNNAFKFGSENFTIECWVYFNAVSTNDIISKWNAGGTPGTNQCLLYTDSAVPKFIWSINGSAAAGTAIGTTLVANRWYHLAVVRNGSSITLYVDGVGGTPVSVSGSLYGSETEVLGISYRRNNGSTQTPINGYVSNVRLVKGTAVYTSNFTPPTEPLTAVAGTSLLTCQSNRVKDSSVNNFTLTKSGDVKVTKFSPYYQLAYNASTLGGSAYFDGTGDYLSFSAINVAVSQSVCAEAWVYLTAYDNAFSMIFGGPSINSADANNTQIRIAPNGDIVFVLGTQGVQTGAGAWPGLNQWVHLAAVRNTNSMSVYVNGVSVGSATASNAGVIQYIGETSNGSGTPYLYNINGYVSDARITVGEPVYTSNFTPPTEPLAAVANTSLLCNFTNAGIFDASTKSVLETVGNAQVDTAVTKFGTGSMYFDGTDSLTFTGATSGAGDFTTEAWVNLSALLDYNVVLDNRTAGTSTTGYAFGVTATGAPYLYTSSGFQIVSSITITANTWNHLALVRSGTTITIYVNGVSGGTYTSSANFSDTNNLIGVTPTFGYIEDLRITKGVARYTANFTPPTQKLGFNNDE